MPAGENLKIWPLQEGCLLSNYANARPPSPPITHYYAFLNPPPPYPLRNYLMDAPQSCSVLMVLLYSSLLALKVVIWSNIKTQGIMATWV